MGEPNVETAACSYFDNNSKKWDGSGKTLPSAGDGTLTVDFRGAVLWDWTLCNVRNPGDGTDDYDLSIKDFTALHPKKGKHESVFTGKGISRCHTSMKDPLDSFVLNTNYFSSLYSGYGPMDVIGHMGGLRDKQGCPAGSSKLSYHCDGRALDICWVQWKKRGSESRYVSSLPCDAEDEANYSTTHHRRLVAVEAGLRKWFGYVLNRYINHLNPKKRRPQQPAQESFPCGQRVSSGVEA